MVTLNDGPNMTLDVYCGYKTTTQQQQQQQLENVFVKHYNPTTCLTLKGNGLTNENITEFHDRICSKVNQFIYTLVCNYMPIKVVIGGKYINLNKITKI